MISHYALSGAIRYYGALPEDVKREGQYITGRMPSASYEESFDLRRWKEPPHFALANLNLNMDTDYLDSVLKFTRLYGFLPGGSREIRGRLRVDVPDMTGLQDLIRRAWAGEKVSLEPEGKTALEALQCDLAPEVRLDIGVKGFEVAVDDLWTFIRILFLRDHFAGRARYCAAANDPECPMPYFLLVRKGQRFCSDLCAVRVNVRRFRERLASKKTLETTGRKHHA